MNIEPKFQTQPETAAGTPLISVVVPVHNESPNIQPLITAISTALAGIDHEIVYVDDGSDDGTAIPAANRAPNPETIEPGATDDAEKDADDSTPAPKKKSTTKKATPKPTPRKRVHHSDDDQ